MDCWLTAPQLLHLAAVWQAEQCPEHVRSFETSELHTNCRQKEVQKDGPYLVCVIVQGKAAAVPQGKVGVGHRSHELPLAQAIAPARV